MFGWKSRATIKEEIKAELKKEEEQRELDITAAANKAREEERVKVKAEQAAREDESNRMKASDEPWVVIKAMVQDPEKGIKIELDWNSAFVDHLRKNGYTGADENAVIQRYVAVLSKQVAEDMAEDMINEHE